MRQIIITILFILLFSACQDQAEPQTIAGYIADCNDEMILIKSDTTSLRLEISDNTIFEERELISGNIVEAIFLPTKDSGDLPEALEIFTDATYPKAIGHWQSLGETTPKIDILLLSHGRIQQNAPQTTLQFTRWQITGRENHITLYGTLSLPPIIESKKEREERAKQASEQEEQTKVPERRIMHFEVEAELSTDDESQTESHRVMTIKRKKGEQHKLYFVED